MPSSLLTVTLAALATALATGLGALPFLALRHPKRAGGRVERRRPGFMLAATVVPLREGAEVSTSRKASRSAWSSSSATRVPRAAVWSRRRFATLAFGLALVAMMGFQIAVGGL